MNPSLHHDPDVFLGTPPSMPLPASKESKRVCFYKSGDPQFTGHWVVINSRTFKSFEALLDALSNKVPLPFGVRTVTTPKGTHAIRSLNDLQHGASYVCSDQRKVRPLNLDQIKWGHVPWNSTRPTSAERQGRRGLIRQVVRKNESGRGAKMAESSVTVRTPKRLVVYKNRDPGTKRIVVLQRRTAPTYEALLEYLSQVMQFPVVKLYTTDGRRVGGLPALILCSGVIVAAGNEPFQQANFNLHASTQPSRLVTSKSAAPTKKPPLRQTSASSRPRSRAFSLSSERYFVNQINRTLKGSRSEDDDVKMGSTVSGNSQALEPEEPTKRVVMSGLEESGRVVLSSDDEIEKSFRVNQDGSMIVEMKVRLTIKQEEMIRWTTTVSRARVNNQRMAAEFSQPISNCNSSDNKDNDDRKRESNIDGHENVQIYKPTRLNKQECQSVNSEVSEKPKARFRRLPTPGPRRVRRKESSAENIKRLSQTEVRKSTVGAYSYMERTDEGELLEGHCIVSHSSSSSTKPVPKVRKKNRREAKHDRDSSSGSGMTEALHNKGTGITESITRIHRSQGTFGNSLMKPRAGEDDWCEIESQGHQKPNSGLRPSSSDCDTDLTKPSTSSGNAMGNELLAIVSGQSSSSRTLSNNASSFTDCEIRARCECSDKTDFRVQRNLKRTDRRVHLKSSVKDKKQNRPKDLKNRESPQSQWTESDKHRQKVKKRKQGQSPVKINAFHSKLQRDAAHSDLQRLQMKEDLDRIPLSRSAPFIVLTKQRCGNGSATQSVMKCKELSESVSMPVLCSSPCDVHQYVNNWLEKIPPESMPRMDELKPRDSRARFQIESDFSDVSEMRYEQNSSPTNKQVSRQFVQTGREGETMEAQHLRRSSNSTPSAPEKKTGTSNRDLIPKLQDTGSEPSPNAQLNPRSGMKQVLEQLCSSVQFIRRACSHSDLSSLEKMKKSGSLPNFSSQLGSVFGSPSKTFLSFLTLMALRDGIANYANEDSSSNPEALRLMQSIRNLTKIDNEEELKSSLLNLHSSTSAQLKRSWRDFQSTNDTRESPPMSPRHSEFALELNSEEDEQDKGHIFGIQEVMDELNMCEHLRREVSLLVSGDFTHLDRTKDISAFEKETANDARQSSDDLGSPLEEKAGRLEADESESEELNLLESSSHNPALLNKVMEESDILKTAQLEDWTNQKGLSAKLVNDVKTNQEWVLDREPSDSDLCVKKDETIDNVHMIDDKNTEHEISQFDQFDYVRGNLQDEAKWRGEVNCVQSEMLSSGTNVSSTSEVIDSDCQRGDFTDRWEGHGVNVKDKNVYCETTEYPEQPDVISMPSQFGTAEACHPNNGTLQTEGAMHSEARSVASDFSGDEARNYNGQNEDPEETMWSMSEDVNPTVEPYHSLACSHEDVHSDNKAHSCSWRESESEYELQKSGEESEKDFYNAKDSLEEADCNGQFDAELSLPLSLDPEAKYSDHSGSYKGQEEETELDLRTSEEESVCKDPTPADETDEHDDSQSQSLDTRSHHLSLGDPSMNGFPSWKSCKSEKKPKAQRARAGIKEVDTDRDCHFPHSTMFPQQLLDFLNLVLKSSALIFTYDSTGCLQIEPDRCKNRAVPLSQSHTDNVTRCLKSPNTSDLSDYRPETSDSGGDFVQDSADLLTESEEDEAERRSISQCRKAKTQDDGPKEPHSLKRPADLQFITSPDSVINASIPDHIDCDSSGSVGNSELAQRPAFDAKPDSGEGILIDKGRWLLKENHLIRKSPPVPIGMYGNVDTTSVDTGQENTSEDAPYVPCGRKPSPLAAISSSELEDMTKPSTPKCHYFNLVHSSDSDPFSDNRNVASNKGRGFTRKSKEVSPLGGTSKTPAKKNGSLPSFTSVDFKLASGKVHPEDSKASSAVEKSARSESARCNTTHEEEPVEDLSLRCGQHCPIL